MQWLPAESEVVARIDVNKLVNGPLAPVLTQLGPQIEEFRQQAGFGPKDISSVMVGVAGISDAIGAGRKPEPEDIPATVVIRANVTIDLAKLQSTVPNAENVTEGSISYLRIPEQPPAAIWLADSTTAVMGTEAWVKQVAQQGSRSPSIDAALFDGQSAIQLAFSPKNPDAVFRSMPMPPAGRDPGQQALIDFLKTVQPTIGGIGIGLDISADIVLSGAIKSGDSKAAAATSQALQKLVDFANKFEPSQMPGGMPPEMMMGLNQG